MNTLENRLSVSVALENSRDESRSGSEHIFSNVPPSHLHNLQSALLKVFELSFIHDASGKGR